MTQMLSNSELTEIRGIIADLLPDTCNVLTATQTADGFGGMSQSWGTASANVSCRLDILSRQSPTSTGGASLREYQETVLSVPYNTTVDKDYRIEHGGFTYNVTATNTDQSWIAVKRVSLERV